MGQGRVRPVFTALPPPGIVSSVSVGAGYALPPPPRLGVPWPQIQGIQPLFHAHEKGSLGSPARLQAPSPRLTVATTFFWVEAGAGPDSWKGPTRAAGWPGREGGSLFKPTNTAFWQMWAKGPQFPMILHLCRLDR